jgi:peptidylprolyl isomerase
MKKTINLLCLFLTIGFVKAEVIKNDTVTTKTGLRYVITKKNPKGIAPAAGDQIEAHYTGTLTNGKKFDSSKDRNQTFSFILGAQQVIPGWDEGFSYLKTGESATLIIPSELGYGAQDMGDIPPNSTLIFEVELVSVKKPIAYTAFSGKGKDTVKLKSGLKYIIINAGDKTNKAKEGQTASIYYAGYLTTGEKFDGNFGTFEPFKLPVVGASVIGGWREILPLMNKGMKVRVIIPAYLAYGEKGYPGVIPPNATLIFDMYLEDLQ